MTDTATHQNIIDALFAPLESRPVTLSTPDIVRRRADYGLGRELARIQGTRPSAARERIRDLVVHGQATPQEAVQLGVELSRQRLLSDNENASCDR